MNKNSRRGIYVLGGLYLVYLAYQLFEGLNSAGSEKPIMIIGMIVFAIVGAILVIQSAVGSYKSAKENMEEQKEYELSKLNKEEEEDFMDKDDELEEYDYQDSKTDVEEKE